MLERRQKASAFTSKISIRVTNWCGTAIIAHPSRVVRRGFAKYNTPNPLEERKGNIVLIVFLSQEHSGARTECGCQSNKRLGQRVRLRQDRAVHETGDSRSASGGKLLFRHCVPSNQAHSMTCFPSAVVPITVIVIRGLPDFNWTVSPTLKPIFRPRNRPAHHACTIDHHMSVWRAAGRGQFATCGRRQDSSLERSRHGEELVGGIPVPRRGADAEGAVEECRRELGLGRRLRVVDVKMVAVELQLLRPTIGSKGRRGAGLGRSLKEADHRSE